MPPPVGGPWTSGDGAVDGSAAEPDSGVVPDSGPPARVEGAVAEVRVFPRLRRPTDTAVVSGWRVSSLLGDPLAFSTTNAMGAFSLNAQSDAFGVVPLRAVSGDGRSCAITTTRLGAPSLTFFALSSGRLQEASAPTGFTQDPNRAQLVVELDDIADRVRDVFVELEMPAPIAVAVDTLDSALAIGNATHTLGTAVLYNFDAPMSGRALTVRLRRANGSARSVTTYIARGCISWLRTAPP